MTDTRIAWALRDEYAGTVLQREHDEDPGTEVPKFSGGVISAAARDLNIGELLAEGDGVIVLELPDQAVITALDDYPALKRVPVPEGATPLDTPLEGLKLADLRDRAKALELEGAGGLTKAELAAVLAEVDRRTAAGETVTAGTHVDALRVETHTDAPEA